MDGVRPDASRVQPMVLPKRRPVVSAPVVSQQRFVVGMDGIRRPVPTASPREVLGRTYAPAGAATPAAPTPAPVPTVMTAQSSGAAVMETPAWKLPSLRLPHVGWKRPAIAFGLVATALIASGSVVRVLATPQATTARAATEVQAPAPTATPAAPVVAATPAPTPQKTGAPGNFK